MELAGRRAATAGPAARKVRPRPQAASRGTAAARRPEGSRARRALPSATAAFPGNRESNYFCEAFQVSKAFWTSEATCSGVAVPRPIPMRPLLITL
jgi:hypothetical protein